MQGQTDAVGLHKKEVSMQPAQSTNFLESIFGTSLLSTALNVAILLVLASILWKYILKSLVQSTRDAFRVRSSRGRPLVFLEITPPARGNKTPEATTALFAGLHGMLASHTNCVSLELVSTRDAGIRYIVVLAPDDVAPFKRLIISYLPTVRMRVVEDYLARQSSAGTHITEFAASAHFAFPLNAHEELTLHDPIAFLTGALTRPGPDELIAFQLVVSPAAHDHISSVRHRLLHGNDDALQQSPRLSPVALRTSLAQSTRIACKWAVSIFGALLSGFRVIQTPTRRAAISPYTEHLLPSVHGKLDQPLFTVSIRALAVSPDAAARLQDIGNSLHQFHRPGYQGLVPLPARVSQIEGFRFRTASAYARRLTILSAGEVASLYHFPFADAFTAENLVRSLHIELPPPLPFKQRIDRDENSIVLGVNTFHDQETLLGLTQAEREKHVYLIGGTGNGKTTLLLGAMLQDIRAGRGIAFIDPHGDAAATLLRHIPKSRLKDVVYVNPRDIAHPIGLNLLQLPDTLSEDELLLERERVTEAVVSVLRKLFADDQANAHRIESMLRNAVRTALTVPDATLFTVLKLLRNSNFRNPIVKKLQDQDLKDFWYEEFNRAGGMQQVSMIKGLTARLDRFRASTPAYRIFNQAKSTINFEDIVDSGKILICNFSTDLGEDTSALFGTSVLALLKVAVERRVNIPEQLRTPFYVYVDEFQNFATQPFVKMLSGSRKYKLYLTIAEQTTAQQAESRLTESILANVGTLICFRTGSPADERLLLPWFTPYLEPGDISNLPTHHFYMRTRAVDPIEPVSGCTQLLAAAYDTPTANQVIAASRKHYAAKYTDTPESLEPASPTMHRVPQLAPVRGRIPKSTT